MERAAEEERPASAILSPGASSASPAPAENPKARIPTSYVLNQILSTEIEVSGPGFNIVPQTRLPRNVPESEAWLSYNDLFHPNK